VHRAEAEGQIAQGREGATEACALSTRGAHCEAPEALEQRENHPPASPVRDGALARLRRRPDAWMTGRRASRASARRFVAVAVLTAAVSLTIFSRGALGASQQPANAVAPSIVGTFKPGQMLTASPGQWSEEPSEFNYRWEVCDPTGAQCKIVRDFSADPSYLLEPRDALGYIRVQVTASNSFGLGGPAASALQKVETAWEWVVGPPKIELATRWSAQPCCGKAERPGTRTLEVSVLTGYCVGEPPPELDHISVIERPVTANRPFRSAVVRARPAASSSRSPCSISLALMRSSLVGPRKIA
jgi:hypothetical protein